MKIKCTPPPPVDPPTTVTLELEGSPGTGTITLRADPEGSATPSEIVIDSSDPSGVVTISGNCVGLVAECSGCAAVVIV